jgi:hypothetical protein
MYKVSPIKLHISGVSPLRFRFFRIISTYNLGARVFQQPRFSAYDWVRVRESKPKYSCKKDGLFPYMLWDCTPSYISEWFVHTVHLIAHIFMKMSSGG